MSRAGENGLTVRGQRLFVLCGLPFAGKSTMGRALHERLGVSHVEVDRYLGGSVGGQRVGRPEWIDAYRLAYREVETELAAGRSVVFDAVGYRRVQRERARRIAAAYGVVVAVIFLDVTLDEARARLAANRERRTRRDVPTDDFLEVAEGLQPPLPDEEPVLRYRPDEPLDYWIDRVIIPLLCRGE